MTHAEKIVDILIGERNYSSALMESIRGEYWITDGDVWFADGDVGDMNHEMYARDTATRKILDLFGTECDEEFCDEDTFRDLIIEALADDDIEVDEENWQTAAIAHIRQITNGQDPGMWDDIWSVALGHGDARDVAVKYWGWIWVRNNSASIWTFTDSDRRNLLDGLNEIGDQEGRFGDDPEDAGWNEEEISVFIASSKKHVSLTIAELESGRTPSKDPTWPDASAL
jgi:hypothetical protein